MPAGTARGFSLIEILVALVIMALSMGVLFQIFSDGLRGLDVSEAYLRATAFAESRMAVVGIETPLVAGELRGETADGLRWVTTIAPYEVAIERLDGQAPIGTLFEVVTQVTWPSGLATREVTLRTLKVGFAP